MMVHMLVAVLLGATLQSHVPDGVVCETQQVPRKISRNVEVLDTVAFCYKTDGVQDPGAAQLAKLNAACELLVTAYGPAEGRKRCRDLIERSGVELH